MVLPEPRSSHHHVGALEAPGFHNSSWCPWGEGAGSGHWNQEGQLEGVGVLGSPALQGDGKPERELEPDWLLASVLEDDPRDDVHLTRAMVPVT